MGVTPGDLGHSIGFLCPMLSVEEGWDLVCNSDLECFPACVEFAIIIAYEDRQCPSLIQQTRHVQDICTNQKIDASPWIPALLMLSLSLHCHNSFLVMKSWQMEHFCGLNIILWYWWLRIYVAVRCEVGTKLRWSELIFAASIFFNCILNVLCLTWLFESFNVGKWRSKL